MLCACAVWLGSCGSQDTEAPAHLTAVESVQAIDRNDMRGLLLTTLGAKEFRALGDYWDRVRLAALSDERRAQVDFVLTLLTAPGAEDKLMTLVEPQIEKWRPQVKEVVIGLQALVSTHLQSTRDADQRQTVAQAMLAFSTWVESQDITSTDLARRAVTILVKTVRDIGWYSADDITALEYETLLGKADILLGGAKQILAAYGLRVDEITKSFDAQTVDQKQDRAKVRMSFDLLGVRQTVYTGMMRVGDRWLSDVALARARDVMSIEVAAQPRQRPQAPVPLSIAPSEPELTVAQPPTVSTPAASDESGATRFFKDYQDALAKARVYQDVARFWLPMRTAPGQDLAELQSPVVGAVVVRETLAGDAAELLVRTDDPFGNPVEGTIRLRRVEDRWRIDDIEWAAADATQPLAGSADVAVPTASAPTPEDDRTTVEVLPPSATATADGGEGGALQSSFDNDPVFARYGMRFRVLGLSRAVATVELRAGPPALVAELEQGRDLTLLDPQRVPAGDDREALVALRDFSDELIQRGDIAALLVVPPRASPRLDNVDPVGVARSVDESPALDPRPRRLVRDIQLRLVVLGYDPGPADGIAGRRTRDAIRAYQAASNLPQDGLISEALNRHMNSSLAVARIPQSLVREPAAPSAGQADDDRGDADGLGNRIGRFLKKFFKPAQQPDEPVFPD